MREGQTITTEVQRLGAQGDGIALIGGKQVYIPLALPGETVRAKIERQLGDNYMADLLEVLSPGADRVTPPCPHFSQCGGCSLQHLAETSYKAHKRNVVLGALHQHRLHDIDVRELITTPPGTRRRVAMTAMHTKNGVILGFNARASHTVVDVTTCTIARPELIALLPKLRAALGPWLAKAKSLNLMLTYTPGGIDLLITGPEPDLMGREAMALLGSLDVLARVSWRANERTAPEPMLQQRLPVIKFSGASIPFPPANFLQASAEGEAILTRLVLEAVAGCTGKIADLFCGLGTFALPLAAQAEVLAAESDKGAVAALKAAMGPHARIRVEARDLFREPFSADELKGYGAVVFDPPRAGAQAQCRELAQSDVPVIAAVSCNPGTFARDAETLIKGGYTCEWVQPVDQFLWSSHVELVAKFRRAA